MKKSITQERTNNKTNRPIVLAAIMLAMFMGAIEGTIISTAMPAIVGDLGGFSLYSWVFSSYLLMNTVTVLIYGKLSDLFGRKIILNIGIVIFLIGSILCGFAESMTMLIIFRFIQGFGAGAVTPIATTIVGDIYTKEERAKIQGYLSSVWGISAVLGPAIGGLLVQYVSWKFVFWINVPLGLLSMIGVGLFLHENVKREKHSIDYKGALWMTISVSILMYLLVEGGNSISWTSFQTFALSAISILAFILFYFQEKKAKEPIMPFSIWKEKTILIANIVSLTTGIMLIGISSFLPTYIQGVMEKSPIIAGFTLTSISIGWPIASTISGFLLLKIGIRKISIYGGISLIISGIMFVTLSPNVGPLWAASGSFLFGLGMGLTSTAFIVSIQSTVVWQQRGIATASNSFMRNLGNTIGAALFGGILNNQLMDYFQEKGKGLNLTIDSANILLNVEERRRLPNNMVEVIQDALTYSLHTVYLGVLFLAVLSMIFICYLPRKEKGLAKK